MNYLNTKDIRYANRNRFEFHAPPPTISESLLTSKFNSTPNIEEPIPDFLKEFLEPSVPFSFSPEEMISHELEMGYIHDYLKLLSARTIDLIKNYYHNFEEIKKYETKLIEFLGLVRPFFSFDLYNENFLHYFVIYSDELFQLLIYSDNFELINQILLNLKIKSLNSLPGGSIQHLKQETKYIPAFIEKFLFADKENSSNAYYEFFLQDEKFLQLKKEADDYFDFQISNKPYYDDSDNLNVTLNIKKENNLNETKKIEIKHLMTIYHKEKPSFLIAQKILEENKLENLQEIDFESFVKLVYSIKYIKLKNEPKKGIYHLINCQVFTNLRDYISWIYDSNKKYYNCEVFNKNHYAFLFAPLLCLNDEKTLKNLLTSFEFTRENSLSTSYKSEKRNDFYLYFSKKVVEVANEIQKVHSENYEIIALTFEHLIYSCFSYISSYKNEAEMYNALFPYLEEVFNKYFLNNEQFQKDPVSLLCNIHFMKILTNFFNSFGDICSFPKTEYYFEETSKIIVKILETLIWTDENYDDLLKKYPKILVIESFYSDIKTELCNSKNTKKESVDKLFQGIFQRILQKIKNAKTSRALDFYCFFIEKFGSYLDTLFRENVLPEEKQAFYDIIEELSLKRKHVICAELENLYRIWIHKDMTNYPTQADLEKNEQDLQNVKNFIRIELHLIMICSTKKSYCGLCVSNLQPFYLLVINELIQYFEWLFEKYVGPNFANLRETLKTLSSDPKNDRIYQNYLVFMLFKARKIKRGIQKVWYSFKDVKNEMMEDQFIRFIDCVTELFSSPLLVGIREKYPFRYTFNLNFPILDKEGKNVCCNSINQLLNKMTEHCNKFEVSYKRLSETTKKNDIFLINYFSNKVKLTHCYYARKNNWEYVMEFLAGAYRKINDPESLEDLHNLAKMKFYLILLKTEMLAVEPKDIAENFYKFCEKASGMFFELISGFAREYLPSQIQEYEELFRKNDYYDISLLAFSNNYNAAYQMVNNYSDFDYRALMKSYKIVKRIYNLPKKMDYFKRARISDADKTLQEKSNTIYEQFANKVLQNYVDFNPKNLHYNEASEIFIKNILTSNFLQTYITNANSYLMATKKKFLKKTSILNENLAEYLKKTINFDICKNNIGPKQITNEIFSKITLVHISVISLKAHCYLLQRIVECVNKDIPRIILLDKIDKKLPFYRSFFRALGEQDIILERSESMSTIYNCLNYENFPNDDTGKKCRRNLSKMYSLLGEEVLVQVMKMKNEINDNCMLYYYLRPIFKTSSDNEEFQKKNRKSMFLKLTDVFQKMIDDLGGNFNLKEVFSLIKDCENDLVGFNELVPFEFEFDIKEFAVLSPLKKMRAFYFMMSTIIQMTDFSDYYPGFLPQRIYTNNIILKHFIDLTILMKEKLTQANEFEQGKNTIFNILSSAMSSFETNFQISSLEIQNKYDFYEENLEMVKVLYDVYCDNRGENNNDPSPLFKIMIGILGDVDTKENLEKTQKIVNVIRDIMLKMKNNYFGQNIPYICLILDKLITFYDETENLQKMNIELKIKQAFYDPFSNQQQKSMKVEEFNSKQDLIDQFTLNGKIFYDVLNNICKISEDKQNIHLREGIEMDKFHSIENNHISKEIISIIEALLEGIVRGIGFIIQYYTSFPEDKSQTYLNRVSGQIHGINIEVLRIMINRFPSLIIYVLNFNVQMEIIDTYFKSFSFLYETLNEKHKKSPKGLNFIDFLWIINPYNEPTTHQIFGIFIKHNYFFKFIQLGDKKCLCSSSLLWKYELLNQCLAEFQGFLDAKQIFCDVNIFNSFYNLLLLTLNLFNKTKLFSKEFLPLDEKITKNLLEKCMTIIKVYNDPKYLPLLKLNSVFFSLVQKVHSRMIKLVVFSKKMTEYEKNDMQYYKFYSQRNISELLSRTVENKSSSKLAPSSFFVDGELKTSAQEYLSTISYNKPIYPKYYKSLKDKILFSSSRLNEYYERLRNNYESYINSRPYENSLHSLNCQWLSSVKSYTSLFGEKNNTLASYNNGITSEYYSYLYGTATFGSYCNIESLFYDKIYKGLNQSQGSLDGLSQFVSSWLSEEFPVEQIKEEQKPEEAKQEELKPEELKKEEQKAVEVKNEEIKPEEQKIEEQKQEELKQEEKKIDETVCSFDFVGKGFPADSLSLFGIDMNYFNALDAVTKEEVLKTEQNKYDERIAQETAKAYNFEINGFPADALTLYSIEKEFFESLPDDLKKDALEQARTEYNKKEEDRKKAQEEKEKNEALMKKLRVLTILENATLVKLAKDQGITLKNALSEEDWSKLCSSIVELNEDTKNHLFKTLPYEVIKDFPEELKKTAKRMRKRMVEFYKNRKEPKENADSCSSSLLSINEQDLNAINEDLFENTPEINDPNQETGNETILFGNYEKKENLEKIFTEISFYDDLPEVDEETFIFVMNCFNSIDPNSDEHRQIRKLIKSLVLLPKNAYKFLDFAVFILSFQDEYTTACSEGQNEIINSTLSKKILQQNIIDLNGTSKTLSLSDMRVGILKLLQFFCEKKLILPLLVNAYTFGCTGLIFENETYQSFWIVTELREMISKRKIAAKKETVFEKLINNYSDSINFFDSFKDIVVYKEDIIEKSLVKYPKIIANVPKGIIINLYSSKIDYSTFANNFEVIENMMGTNIEGLMNLALKNIHKEIEKWAKISNSKKERILEYKKKHSLTQEICSLQEQNKKDEHWGAINNITDENYYELKSLRRDTRKILKKLQLALNKFAKNESKKKVDLILATENPEGYKEARKQVFYEIVHEILHQIHEKIHQDDTILLFFKEFFELCFVILNVVGNDFSFDINYTTRQIYVNNRSIFKLFIDFYSFLNPLGEEYQIKKKESAASESPTRPSTSKLSKLRTSAPEEEKKEVKFKSEKIGKIFGAFARKADVDISLKNSLGMTYGRLAFFVEIFMQFGLYNNNRISKAYNYYIKKAPSDQSITANIKFYYLNHLAKEEAKKKCDDESYDKISLDRNSVWQSTLEHLLKKTPAELTRSRLNVEFKNEQGIDAGGLTREWLSLLVKEVFDPERGLFKPSENKISYQPNPLSFVIPDHLIHFRMLGRLIAKALIEKWNIEVFFVKSFLKHILQKTLFVNDLQDVDAELYNSMKWVMENPIDEMGFVFSYEKKEFEKLKTVDLIENGNQIDVVESNKKEFVKAMAYAKMAKEIEAQTEAMIQGITEIIPAEALSVINEKDLGVRLAGVPSINVDEMEKYVIFYSYNRGDKIISWLFEILREFDETMKAKYLFYILGCFRVPIGGFKAFPMKINSLSDTKSLPIAHTCFGQIDLPNYSSKEILKEKLTLAITEGGGTGFFFG